MAGKLAGQRVAFLAAPEGTEQVELTEPWQAVRSEGGEPVLVSLQPGEVVLFHHLDKGDTWPVDVTVDRARPDDYLGLVLPGGVANPDQLRMDQRAVDFVRGFVDSGRPVAVICHGPWTLVEADAVRGRTLTSYPSVRTDISNAGGQWVDEPVVICDQGPNVLVSSRNPKDLRLFCQALVEQFSVVRSASHR
jgi:protease I